MADWDENEDTAGIKELRKQFKELAKARKADQALIEELRAERSATSVYDALASRGMDPRIAKFYPKDAQTDDASVQQWIDENKELFPDRRVGNEGEVNTSTLTESEQRGYQTQRDIAAYDAAIQMDLKSRLDQIKYDPNNPDAAAAELMAKLKEFEGYVNQ
jgi:hypothetical protein